MPPPSRRSSNVVTPTEHLRGAPKPPRPVFTYLAFAVAVAGAIWVELTTMHDPEMRGASFVFGAPVIMTGYGIDWARLTRPGAVPVASALILAATAAHAVLFGWFQDWDQVIIGTVGVAAGLISLCWAAAALPTTVVEATFVGRQEGRWLFSHGQQCWDLESKVEVEAVVGESYVLRAKLTAGEGGERGPYRASSRARGKLLDIASDPAEIRRRRWQQAWAYTRGVVTAAALICIAVALPHAE